jgi:hypothetical protein
MAAKSAIPTHLKPEDAIGNGDAAGFARKHHGKTQSHVVRFALLGCSIVEAILSPLCPLTATTTAPAMPSVTSVLRL